MLIARAGAAGKEPPGLAQAARGAMASAPIVSQTADRARAGWGRIGSRKNIQPNVAIWVLWAVAGITSPTAPPAFDRPRRRQRLITALGSGYARYLPAPAD